MANIFKRRKRPKCSFSYGTKNCWKNLFLITKEGKKYAIASIIDAQESEDSGLFDGVFKYSSNCEDVLKELIAKINPNKIALNYSVNDNLCDGLTVGRYRWLMDVLGDEFNNRVIKSEVFKKIRSIKSPLEIQRIKKAIDITLEIYEEVFDRLKVGLSEYEVGEMFVEGMKKEEL